MDTFWNNSNIKELFLNSVNILKKYTEVHNGSITIKETLEMSLNIKANVVRRFLNNVLHGCWKTNFDNI